MPAEADLPGGRPAGCRQPGEPGALGPANDLEHDQFQVVGDPCHAGVIDPVGIVAGPMIVAVHAGEGEQDRNVLGVKRLVITAAETVGDARDSLDRRAPSPCPGRRPGCRCGVEPVPIIVSSFLPLSRPTMSKLIIMTV